MKARMCFRSIALLLVLLFCIPTFISAGAASSQREIKQPARTIYIVLDDSGSMDNARLYYSNYALEVFVALMGEKDEIRVYRLNKSEVLKIEGSSDKRMDKIYALSKEKAGGTTPYRNVRTAAAELSGVSDTRERWLIILSDGEFDEWYNRPQNSEVQNDLNQLNAKGIHTVFLSIESANNSQLADNGTMGRYYMTDASHVQAKLSDISNMVFDHLVLPTKKNVRRNGNTYELNIDIPIDQLIVFAQGKNASVTSASLNSKSLKPTADYSIEPYNQWGTVIKSVKGVVCRYDKPEGQFYDSGVYQVTVSDAEQVEFYYRPAVELECSLVSSSGTIYAEEEQEASIYFVHPQTGAKITSDLLSGAEMYLTITNNGKSVIDNEKAGQNGLVKKVKLETGKAEVTARAELPGGVVLKKGPQTYTVEDAITDTRTVFPAMEIRQIDLKNNKTINFKAQIVNAKTKVPVDQRTWDITTCSADDSGGIKLEVTKKGMQAPEVLLTPSAKGKLSDVQTGDVKFTVYTQTKGAEKVKTEVTIRVIPYEPIRIKDASASFNQISLGSGNTTEFVEITVVDKETGAALSKDTFQKTELTVKGDSGQGLNWVVEKTGKNGVWKLTPQAKSKKTDITTGQRTVTLEAVYDDGNDFTGDKAIKCTGTLNVTIDKTPPRTLDVSHTVPSEPYLRARTKLTAHEPIEIKVRYNGGELPQTAWDAAGDDSLQLTWDDSEFDLKAEKSSTKGVWIVRVLPHHGKGYRTGYGTFDVDAKVEIYDPDEEVAYSGTDRFTFTMEPDWLGILWEFWLDWWWAIVGTIVAAGYIFKKKFAFFALMKVRKLRIEYNKPPMIAAAPLIITVPLKIRFWNLLTFLLPFLDQKLKFDCSNMSCNCEYGTWKIVAVKRWGGRGMKFKLRNPRDIPLKNISTIDNAQYKTPEDLMAERSFMLDGLVVRGNTAGSGKVTVYISED